MRMGILVYSIWNQVFLADNENDFSIRNWIILKWIYLGIFQQRLTAMFVKKECSIFNLIIGCGLFPSCYRKSIAMDVDCFQAVSKLDQHQLLGEQGKEWSTSQMSNPSHILPLETAQGTKKLLGWLLLPGPETPTESSILVTATVGGPDCFPSHWLPPIKSFMRYHDQGRPSCSPKD